MILFYFIAFAHSAELQKPKILNESVIKVDALMKKIGQYPAKGTVLSKQDFDQLRMTEKRRTEKNCQIADGVKKISLNNFYAQPDGPLTSVEVKNLSPLFDDVAIDVSYYVEKLKNHYQRPRPQMIDKKISLCVDKENSYSYPSLHATVSFIYGALLEKWDPKRNRVISARTKIIRRSRLYSGVDHPSDIEAGMKLGEFFLEQYFKDKVFTSRFQALAKP